MAPILPNCNRREWSNEPRTHAPNVAKSLEQREVLVRTRARGKFATGSGEHYRTVAQCVVPVPNQAATGGHRPRSTHADRDVASRPVDVAREPISIRQRKKEIPKMKQVSASCQRPRGHDLHVRFCVKCPGAGNAHLGVGRRRRCQSLQPHGAVQDVRRRDLEDRYRRRDQLPRSGGFGGGDHHEVDLDHLRQPRRRRSSRRAPTASSSTFQTRPTESSLKGSTSKAWEQVSTASPSSPEEGSRFASARSGISGAARATA